MKSYSPYSGIEESCYIMGESGIFYPGVRIENVSYPLTISALQAAVCSCLANGDVPDRLLTREKSSELQDYWVRKFNLVHDDAEPVPEMVYAPLLPKNRPVDEMLHELTGNAVTPHSSFPVAALLETKQGYIPGVNVEVSAWALGLCAERVAISRALASGFTNLKSIIVYAPKADFVSPCGACRQVLTELMPDATLELQHGDGTLSKHIVSHMLPHGFTSAALKK
jgi:cytidine deaminase